MKLVVPSIGSMIQTNSLSSFRLEDAPDSSAWIAWSGFGVVMMAVLFGGLTVALRVLATVVVFGAGPVGIMAARCAWLFGAGRVIVIDYLDYRLEFARNYAPCEAYNFQSLGDPVVFLKRTTDWMGADVCIDAVGAEAAGSAMQTLLGRKMLLQGGSATALHWAINSVKKGGIVSIVGVYGPIDPLIPIGNVV